jgi:hypothetical protein
MKGGTKIIAIVTIIIIIIILFSISFCWRFKDDYSFKYEVKFSTDNNSSNTILIPILINQYTGNISKAMDYIKIEGNYSYKYEDTFTGTMLNLTGRGSFHVLAKGNKKIPFAVLNSLVDLDNDGAITDEGGKNCKYWIYIQSEYINSSISLEIHSSIWEPTSGVSCRLTYKGPITNDWIMTNGSQSHMQE